MKRNSIILILILWSQTVICQSLFYNSKGQLNADTNLSISLDQLDLWKCGVEYNLVNHLSTHYNYPTIASENRKGGEFILELTIDSNGILSNCRSLSDPGWYLSDSAISALRSYVGYHQLAQNISLYSVYYLPVKLKLERLKIGEYIEENKVIIKKQIMSYGCVDDY